MNLGGESSRPEAPSCSEHSQLVLLLNRISLKQLFISLRVTRDWLLTVLLFLSARVNVGQPVSLFGRWSRGLGVVREVIGNIQTNQV